MDLYERVERVETRKNPATPTLRWVKVSRVIPSGTGMYKIAVGDDGKPRDATSYRASLEGLARALAQLVNDSRSQRDAWRSTQRGRRIATTSSMPRTNAFLFALVSTEQRGDHTLSKYKMDPNPAFRPQRASLPSFPKVRGFVWIEESSGELARIEGDVTEDISVGLFLGKIYKGSTSCRSDTKFYRGVARQLYAVRLRRPQIVFRFLHP